MKRLFCALIALTLIAALVVQCEAPPANPFPSAELVAESAEILMRALLMCPAAQSFDEVPGSEFAYQAIQTYKSLGGEDVDDFQIYDMIFANGEYQACEYETELYFIPIQIEIDSALDAYDGSIKASVSAYTLEGSDREFYCMADIYLIYDEQAPHQSRVKRLFFPE